MNSAKPRVADECEMDGSKTSSPHEDYDAGEIEAISKTCDGWAVVPDHMATGRASKADSNAGEVQEEDDCVYRLGIFDVLVQGVVEMQGKDGEQGRAKGVRVYVYFTTSVQEFEMQ